MNAAHEVLAIRARPRPASAGSAVLTLAWRALLKIKEQYRDEKNLILSADTDVVYDVVIQTMDACRVVKVKGPDGSPRFDDLFPAISLSLIG